MIRLSPSSVYDSAPAFEVTPTRLPLPSNVYENESISAAPLVWAMLSRRPAVSQPYTLSTPLERATSIMRPSASLTMVIVSPRQSVTVSTNPFTS